MRKILVPIKRVPDYAARVKIAADGKSVQMDGVKWIVNPFDEIAAEEALRIKERFNGEVEVVVVSVGPDGVSEQIRSVLAMGADRAILVVVVPEAPIDSDVAHRALAEIYKRESPDIVIMGKQSIDLDANQTGQLLAAKLEIAQATFVSKLEIDPNWTTAVATREVDGGLERVSVTLPAVITTDLRLNEARYPSLPNIVKAKKKQLDLVPIETLGIDTAIKVEIVAMELPPVRKAGVRVDSVKDLVERLQKEAKVL